MRLIKAKRRNRYLMCLVLGCLSIRPSLAYDWIDVVNGEHYPTLTDACMGLLEKIHPDPSCQATLTFVSCDKSASVSDPPSGGGQSGAARVYYYTSSNSCGSGYFYEPNPGYGYRLYTSGKFFLVANPPTQPSQGACCDAGASPTLVADPINVASGSMSRIDSDIKGDTRQRFIRFYDTSGGNGANELWRHSFNRSVLVKYSSIEENASLNPSSITSSQYTDPVNACINGFAEIRTQVSNWSGAVASYSDGNCQLTKSGVSIGSLTVYFTGNGVAPGAQPVAYDVIRDDGQLIRFTVNNGAITAPPGISLQLAQTASGFTITDVNNNVEQYDMNGRLLSVTSRSGVVQTMSYDASGRLGGVADSFGHQLILSYDAQDHLISVMRQ